MNCKECWYGKMIEERVVVVGETKFTYQHSVECHRYPQELRKEVNDCCGEFKPKNVVQVDAPDADKQNMQRVIDTLAEAHRVIVATIPSFWGGNISSKALKDAGLKEKNA